MDFLLRTNIKKFDNSSEQHNSQIYTGEIKYETDENPEESIPTNSINRTWDGAVVAVVGLQDKGKTFVLNAITRENLPSGKKVNTKGLSFKHVNMEKGTKLILLDTAGSQSPVKVTSELSVVEKEATELFLLDLVFDLSDYFIFVVNDFTSLDQRYLDKLSRGLQHSVYKTFREIIVIHNLKDVESIDILDHLWKTQVTQIYGSGSVVRTCVAANDPSTGKLTEKHVVWFKTNYSRHICVANADCAVGLSVNPWAFSLLRYWLKAVFVPVNGEMSIVESVIKYSNIKLEQYFRHSVKLKIRDTNLFTEKYLYIEAPNNNESIKIPQVLIDSSGLVINRPDSFIPAVDIIKNSNQCIQMDIPGLDEKSISIVRQNVLTIVKGKRILPYDVSSHNITFEKQERKIGEFTMTFRIPEIQERKWYETNVENGVLIIKQQKDEDDLEKKNEIVEKNVTNKAATIYYPEDKSKLNLDIGHYDGFNKENDSKILNNKNNDNISSI